MPVFWNFPENRQQNGWKVRKKRFLVTYNIFISAGLEAHGTGEPVFISNADDNSCSLWVSQSYCRKDWKNQRGKDSLYGEGINHGTSYEDPRTQNSVNPSICKFIGIILLHPGWTSFVRCIGFYRDAKIAGKNQLLKRRKKSKRIEILSIGRFIEKAGLTIWKISGNTLEP